MIVPTPRLLWGAALVVFPLSTLATASPALSGPAILILGAGALLILGDALLSKDCLDGIEIQSQKLVRLSLHRPGSFSLSLRETRTKGRTIRLAPVLPLGLQSSEGDRWVNLTGDGTYRLQWPIEGRSRGRWPVQACQAEQRSFLGFWMHRREFPLVGEVRIYPSLMEDRKSLAPFFLRRGPLGSHQRRQVGRGREFEKLRDYLPGDSVDDIHWKASARRDKLVTKEYQVERTQEVIVLVDSSRLSAKKVSQEPNLEKRIRAALLLSLATRQYGDHFGLITFSDRILQYLPPRGGSAHFQSCREALYTLETQGVSPDFVEVATFLRTRFRRRALLIFLTDLSDPALAEDFLRGSLLLGRDHVVLVCSLVSPDIALLFTQKADSIPKLFERLAGHLVWKRLRALSLSLRKQGVTLAHLPAETFSAEVIGRYLRVKERQLL